MKSRMLFILGTFFFLLFIIIRINNVNPSLNFQFENDSIIPLTMLESVLFFASALLTIGVMFFRIIKDNKIFSL